MARELVELAETRAEAKKMAARYTNCKTYVRAYEMKGIAGWRTVFGVYVPQTCFRAAKKAAKKSKP